MEFEEFIDEILEFLTKEFRERQKERGVHVWNAGYQHTNADRSVIEARINFSVGEPCDLLFIRGKYNDVYIFTYNEGWTEIGNYGINTEGLNACKKDLIEYFFE